MLPLNPWENHFAIKALYSKCVEPVCAAYHITRTELDILLFLVNNPCFDTAADIVEIRYLAKSHVSTSIRNLESLGYLEKYYVSENQKSVHISVCESAASLIADGKKAQEEFFFIICKGLSLEEIRVLQDCFVHMMTNIRKYLKEEEK